MVMIESVCGEVSKVRGGSLPRCLRERCRLKNYGVVVVFWLLADCLLMVGGQLARCCCMRVVGCCCVVVDCVVWGVRYVGRRRMLPKAESSLCFSPMALIG